MAEFLITDNADDGADLTGVAWDADNTDTIGTGSNASRYGGFRFQNVTIAKNASIDSAIFHLYIKRGYKNYDWFIDGVTDNFDAFSNSNLPSERTVTTAQTVFDASADFPGTSWADVYAYYEIDVTAVVQEIVNLSGWSSGEALALLIYSYSSQDRRFSYADSSEGSSTEPKLVITVSGNSTPVVTPPSNTSIAFASGAGGLAKNNGTLTTWLATASAADAEDGSLSVSGDLSALADPIPAGTYTITFTSAGDSGDPSLTGSDTAILTIVDPDISTYLITADADDGADHTVGSNWNPTSTGTMGANGDAYGNYGGFRFQNISIDQGAVIDSAYLHLYVKTGYKNTDVLVSGVVDNFDAFSNSNLPRDRTKTSALTTYDMSADFPGTAWVVQNKYFVFDVKEIVQEIVTNTGWATGQALALLVYAISNQARQFSYADSNEGSSTEPTLIIEVSDEASIGNVDTDNIITYDQTAVVVNGPNIGSTTEVRLKYGSITETITPDSTTDTTVTFDPVLGDLPLGGITLELYDGTDTTSIPITLAESALNDYVVVASPSVDATSIYNAATHTPLAGNILEYTEAADVTLQANGTYSLVSGSVITSFDVREWRIDLDAWGSWTTFTVGVGGNQPPIVIAPSSLVVDIPNGSSGLAKSDSRVVAFLIAATVTDDEDTVTVSADISGLADPIPPGVHVVTFTSTADSGSLIGSDTSQIIITEEVADNTEPVVTPPSDLQINFTYGASGLAKSNAILVGFLAAATVSDDVDTLTASGDISGLADPIPSGSYEVTFTSQVDSGGLTGSSTATLTIAEGLPANQAPVVTAPANLEIEFVYGGAGLDKSNVTLDAWLASSSVTDDYDGGLIALGDISALADPIPAGTYTVSFAAIDSGSLTGQDTADLIITEAASATTPIAGTLGLLWDIRNSVSNNLTLQWTILNASILTNIPLPNRIMKIL